MSVLLGPILYAGACTQERWRFRIQMLIRAAEDEPPFSITATGGAADVSEPELVHTFREFEGEGAYLWSWPVEVRRSEADQWIAYEVAPEGEAELPEWLGGGGVEGVFVPKKGALPRFAFFSCNGVSEEKLYHQLDRPERLWHDMYARHREAAEEEKPGFGLLLGGGDQVYADELWNHPPLRRFREMDQEERIEADVPTGFVADLKAEYVKLYARHWGRPGMREMFARVPGVFTWDDHDIMDGWGSHSERLQSAPCYKALYEAASECFRAFQLGGTAERCVGEGDHFLQALRFREAHQHLDVVVLDIRSGRTRNRVMSIEQWEDLIECLDEMASGVEGAGDVAKHLLVVSSIPVVFIRYLIDELPINVGGLQDDLIDQWEHGRHRGERARLLMRLLRHAKKAGCRTTLLSGDVHVGARARVVSNDPRHVPERQGPNGPTVHPKSQAIIHQVTASGIGHPPPSYWQWLGIKTASTDEPDQISDQVQAEVMPVSSDRQFLRARNWLSGTFDDPETVEQEGRTRLWMQWRVEEHDPVEGGITARAVSEEVVVDANSSAPSTA